MKPFWLVLAPVIFLCLWSGGYVVAKFGIRHADPLTLLAIRFGLVVILMGAVFWILGLKWPQTKAEWIHTAIVGLLLQTVYFGFTYLAFDVHVASGTVALLMSLQPILVAIVAPAWTGEQIGWRRWTGLALGLIGTVIVIASRLEIAAPPLIGFAFSAVALFGVTSATLWEKRFGSGVHPVTASLIGFGAGFLGILPLAMLTEEMAVNVTWELVWALGYLVIGNSLIATSLLLAMIRFGEVSRVSALMFLIPPAASVLAWLTLGEIMPPLAWLGMAVAIVGVLIATRAR